MCTCRSPKYALRNGFAGGGVKSTISMTGSSALLRPPPRPPKLESSSINPTSSVQAVVKASKVNTSSGCLIMMSLYYRCRFCCRFCCRYAQRLLGGGPIGHRVNPLPFYRAAHKPHFNGKRHTVVVFERNGRVAILAKLRRKYLT